MARELLIAERKDKGVEVLSDELGCSISTISRYLNPDIERWSTEPYTSRILQRYGNVDNTQLAQLLKLLAKKPQVLPALLKVEESEDEETKKHIEDSIILGARKLP